MAEACPEDWSRCEICGRNVPAALITQHHLTPKEKGGKAEHRVPVCRPCHKQVHALYGNTDLAKLYSTIDVLRQAPEMRHFIKWVRKQDPQSNVSTRQSNAHPGRGKR